MNQRTVEINGKKVILTERPASDVLDVFDYYDRYEDNEKKSFAFNVKIAAWITFQSLRSTRKNIPLWLFWKKLKYFKYGIKYLTNVAPYVLLESQSIILELDELNKKKEEAEVKESPALNQNS